MEDADANDLYDALDWLLDRQDRIEKKLAKRHLEEGAVVLFDVSSSSYHGRKCPLAQRRYNRDGEKLSSIVYGLLANGEGRPVAVDVYPGNTGDPSTVLDQVEKLRFKFGLERIVLVGDRGVLQPFACRRSKADSHGTAGCYRNAAHKNCGGSIETHKNAHDF